jgi:hypothetical protein
MQALKRIRDGFGGAAAAAALIASPAIAQQAPDAEAQAAPVTETVGTECGIVEAPGYTQDHAASCATPGYEEPRTLEEILADENLSRSVVLHFGDGLLDANLLAKVLSDNGVPTVAIPGGDVNTVEIVLAGWTNGRLKFDQWQLAGGRVATVASRGYERRMAMISADAGEARVIRTAAASPSGSD